MEIIDIARWDIHDRLKVLLEGRETILLVTEQETRLNMLHDKPTVPSRPHNYQVLNAGWHD